MKRIDFVRPGIQLSAALFGVLLALLIWGRATPEELKQGAQAKQFAELPVAVQERIRPAWEDLQSLSKKRQADVVQIHQAVTANPALTEKLNELAEWWTTLNDFDRYELRNLDRDQMLTEISTRFAADQNRESLITVEFNIWSLIGRGGSRFGERSRPPASGNTDDRTIPPLALTTKQFATLLQNTVSNPALECQVPALAEQLTSPEHQLLLNCLVVQDSVLEADDVEQRLNRLQAINKTLLEDVPDTNWRNQYRTRLARSANTRRWYGVMTPQLLLRSLVQQLGRRLRGKITLDDETIISEFAAISDQNERQSLMVRRPSDAIRRIEQRVFVTQQASDSPERQLIQRFLSTEHRINEFLRSPSLLQRLISPGSGFGPGSNGRPPPGPGRENRPRGPRDQNR
jgi:hypothetical protein